MAVVIDTNVLQVANLRAGHAGPDCVLAVVTRLENVQQGERICLDQSRWILNEYLHQGFSFSGQPGVGDAFFRWLFDNQSNLAVCEQVDVVCTNDDGTEFEEFPPDSDLAGFDRSDRKFVAVALTSTLEPVVLNAVDSDWWIFRDALHRNGIEIEFLCPGQFEA